MAARREPAYSVLKPGGQARVRIDDKDHCWGVYGTPEPWDRHDDLIAEWFAMNGNVRVLPENRLTTVTCSAPSNCGPEVPSPSRCCRARNSRALR